MQMGTFGSPTLEPLIPPAPELPEPTSEGAFPPVSGEERAEAAALADRLFERYDVDQSGSLNTHNELRMFTINLCFKLELNTTQKDVDAELREFPDSFLKTEPMTKGGYLAWFEAMHPKFKYLGEQLVLNSGQ